MKRLYRLRTILLAVMLSVLALPIGAIHVFRTFENVLVRETEQELISQAAVLSATWRNLVLEQAREFTDDLPLTPIAPRLSLNDPVAPPRPEAEPAETQPAPNLVRAASLFARIMRETQQITLAGMRLLDERGTVLAGRSETGLSLAHVPEVRQALVGEYASVIRRRISDEPRPSIYSISRGTDVRVFVAMPVLDGETVLGVVYLSRTPVSILKSLFDVRYEVALAMLVMSLLTVLLGLFVSSGIARPIRELLRQIDLLRTGEIRTVQPLARPVTQEMARLSESFVSMSESLAERADYIKRFAGHVSHEFKTPLASMQGALELLTEHMGTMDPEQSRQFLNNLQADTRRMKLLVNRLLELARADAMPPSRSRCRLDTVAGSVHSAFRDRGLTVDFDEDCETELPIAQDALEMVLGNLAKNSLQHGADRIRLSVSPTPDSIRLAVADNGRGISQANRDKVFTPFFTTRRASGGTGLGLEICRSVLKAHGAGIDLGESNQGATFVLEFRRDA
ncbi:MAG: sensor histidine kinase [Desulfomicrobium sp.]